MPYKHGTDSQSHLKIQAKLTKIYYILPINMENITQFSNAKQYHRCGEKHSSLLVHVNVPCFLEDSPYVKCSPHAIASVSIPRPMILQFILDLL